MLRARRTVDRLRAYGYPTPAWLAVGSTAAHVWHLVDFVDAAPAPGLTPSLVEQLLEIVELQAGQAGEPPDHWAYAWRVVTGREPVVAALSALSALSGRSTAVSALVERAHPVDGVRRRVWARVLAVVGWRAATVLVAARVLLELEWRLRRGRHDLVPAAVGRGQRLLDELDALR